MARLSNYTREKMATALTDHRYADRVTDLTAESRALFKALYEAHHDAAARKHIAALVKINRDAFARSSSLYGNVGGAMIEVGQVYLAGRWRVEVEALPCFRDVSRHRAAVAVEVGTDLAARIMAFGEADKCLREDVTIAQREALGALQQFTTDKKLADEWPEAMPVIGDLIPEDDRTLPVIQVGRLNDKFKLPPHAKLAA